MGKAEDRPVYQCMYRLLMLILDARDKFPKNYRYEFGTELMMYNPQIEMFARFKMKSSFHKTKRII